VRSIIFVISALILATILGYFSTQLPATKLIWGGLALALFAISFLKIELGLYVLIFSMLLSPEIIIGETAGSSLGRGVTLRLEDFLLVVIGFSWFAKNAINKELGLFFKTPLNKAILLYSLACTLATGFGIMAGRVDPKTGFFFVLKYMEYFIVLFMMVNHVRDTDQIKRFVFCLLLTCFIACIIGIMQIPAGGRVSAPFEGVRGEPNTFGGYLLFMGAVAAGILSRAENSRTKNMLIGLIFVIIPPFLFTLSRASYLAFVPTLLVLGYLMEKKVILVGIIFISLALSPLFLPLQVKNRILFTVKQPEHHLQIKVGNVRLDTSTSERLRSWKDALVDWSRKPILGHGVTGYRFVDAQFPRVLAETGIIGLIAFIYLLYSIGKTAVDNLRVLKNPFFRGITIGFLAGYTGLLFHAIGANTFIIVRIMEPFWFFVGIVIVLPILEHTESRQLFASKAITAKAPFDPRYYLPSR
jgi:hypothetical protein